MAAILAGATGPGLLTAPACVAAQQVGSAGPPAPAEPRPLALPELVEARLGNGVEVLIVPNRELPLVSVELVLPGGQAHDPDGIEGVSLLTASLLESGTSSRTHEQIVGQLDRLGASLEATADADWTRVSLVALTEALEPALAVMADVVSDPVFPAARLETIRRQAKGALAAQRSRPPALARRVMLREVYATHPYGRQTTESTLDAIDREALVAHHRRWYRPGSALLVVAGDVDPERIVERMETAFGDWRGGRAPDAPGGAPPRPEGGIVLVHRPGAIQAEVRIGYPLPSGDAADWMELEVATHHLGATPSGLLHRRLREEAGWTYSATATAERRLRAGVLEVAFAARNEVVTDALGEALRLIDGMGARALAPEDLRGTVNFLAGAIPLQSETPQQIADRIARRRLLGLDPSGVERLVPRLRSLTPGQVRRAFDEAVDPSRRVVVVVGDAAVLQPELSTFGRVRVESPDGSPLSMADLVAADRTTRLDATELEAVAYRYDVTLQGRAVGSLTREVTVQGDERTVRSELGLGPRTMTQTVTFGAADFDFRTSSMALEEPGAAVTGRVGREGDRITGVIDTGVARQPVDIEVPNGVVVADMLEVAIWLTDLEVGREIRLPVAGISNGTVANATLRVVERTSVTVPAGTFDVFRIEVEGAEAQTIWARAAAPHIPVRVEPAEQQLVVELAEIRPPAGESR